LADFGGDDGAVGDGASGAGFAAPECLNCGACCFSAADNYVPVTGDDWSRLGPDAEKWAAFVSNRVFMRMEHGHCAALQLMPPEVAGGASRFVCSIYATRPQVCRDLARGSAECHGEWTMKRQIAAKAVDRLNQK
jgi:Fe-S-cluster containining protein